MTQEHEKCLRCKRSTTHLCCRLRSYSKRRGRDKECKGKRAWEKANAFRNKAKKEDDIQTWRNGAKDGGGGGVWGRSWDQRGEFSKEKRCHFQTPNTLRK